MIIVATGNLLEAPAEALVNAVNCVGVMGKGLALQFKQAYPEMFTVYAAACRAGEVRPGAMLVYETGRNSGPRFIINFPTKRHWREPSRIEDVQAGLAALVAEVRERGIRSLAVPALGCGLGGLDWPDVRGRIEASFASLPEVRVHLFAPQEPATAPGKVALA